MFTWVLPTHTILFLYLHIFSEKHQPSNTLKNQNQVKAAKNITENFSDSLIFFPSMFLKIPTKSEEKTKKKKFGQGMHRMNTNKSILQMLPSIKKIFDFKIFIADKAEEEANSVNLKTMAWNFSSLINITIYLLFWHSWVFLSPSLFRFRSLCNR